MSGINVDPLRAGVKVRLGILGDYRSDFEPHPATRAALEHAAGALTIEVRAEWIGTPELETLSESELSSYDGLWAAPGSPYQSLPGMLRAIRFARESRLPLLGTCAGFQHMAIEFARNVLGIKDAQSAEYEPDGAELVVTAVACAVAGKIMTVEVEPGSLAHSIYGRTRVREQYYCRYGLNPAYRERLHRAGLRVEGVDSHGDARIVAVSDHPFYLGTLFVPQVASAARHPHPLVCAFLRAAASHPALVRHWMATTHTRRGGP